MRKEKNSTGAEQTYHWHCEKCGHNSPTSEMVCPGCGESLNLYGKMVADEAPTPPPPPRPYQAVVPTAPPVEVVRKREPPKPRESTKAQRPRRMPDAVPSITTGDYFKQVKNIFLFLQMYILLSSIAVFFTAEAISWYATSPDYDSVLLIAVPIINSIILIVFSRTRKYVLQGLLNLILGALSMVVLLYLIDSLAYYEYYTVMLALMCIVYLYVTVVSFICASKKRGITPFEPFMSKPNVLVWYDSLTFLTSLAVFFCRWYIWDNMFGVGDETHLYVTLVAPAVLLLICVIVLILLAGIKRYVAHFLVNFVVLAAVMLLAFLYLQSFDVILLSFVGIQYLCACILSFKKEYSEV